MLTSSSIGQISQRCQERVAQRGHTHKGVYLGSHQPAASAQSAVSSQAVPGGRGCRKESLAHQHLYTNLVRAWLCPLACNPLHCLMEGTVSGSTTALPPAHSQARPGQGWGDGTGQGWLLVVGRKNASCLGTEKSVGVSCAFAAREQPPVTLHQCIYYLTGGGQHLSSVPAGLWKEQVASCLSLSTTSSVAAPCPVLQTPSPQEDAHGSGPPASRGVSVSQLQWQQGVMLTVGICPAPRPWQAGALIPSRLSL